MSARSTIAERRLFRLYRQIAPPDLELNRATPQTDGVGAFIVQACKRRISSLQQDGWTRWQPVRATHGCDAVF